MFLLRSFRLSLLSCSFFPFLLFFLRPSYFLSPTFAAALTRGRYDALVIGRGFFPPQNTHEQSWAIAAGWRTISLSRRLRVLAPPRR